MMEDGLKINLRTPLAFRENILPRETTSNKAELPVAIFLDTKGAVDYYGADIIDAKRPRSVGSAKPVAKAG